MQEKFYLTTTLPYVNADPHLGFAYELVAADALVRYRNLMGDRIFFNTGTDEHGLKIYRKALEAGKDPQSYVDEYAAKFKDLKDLLGLSGGIHFIRTTDPHHKKAAQEFWKRCERAGDIYKKLYKIKYCVGCELEKTDSELVDGRCPLHPHLEIEFIEEDNYFFRFSKYQQPLLDLYEKYPDFVVPSSRLGEIKAFVSRGLEDFSISRLKTKMPWGVPVPGDDAHVMFVWFDALINYISTLGWPEDEKNFNDFWGTKEDPKAMQIGGKDQLRQQSAMWQAMLMSVGLPTSRRILIHGFITSGGQKMSKSLGNVLNPAELITDYGTEALRYFLLRHVHPFEDSDVTPERIKEAYNGNLANGLGNLVARVMKMAEDNLDEPVDIPHLQDGPANVPSEELLKDYHAAFQSFNVQAASDIVWRLVQELDVKITLDKPFEVVKNRPEEAKNSIRDLVGSLPILAHMLAPLMPETSRKIFEAVKTNKKPENLFARKD